MNWIVFLIAAVSLGTLARHDENEGNKRRFRSVTGEPAIREVRPSSAKVGEKVKLEGKNLGAAIPVVTFNGVPAVVLKAEDDELRVIVPAGATTGPLVVVIGDRNSNAVHFVVEGADPVNSSQFPIPQQPGDSSGAPPTPSNNLPVSFSKDIQPIFTRSCTDCHGGSAGLFLDEGESYASLVNVPATKGCTSEMRVQPGKAEASVLVKRVSGSSCGTQMPKKGPPLSTAEVAAIRQWIDSGALNN